jgi:Uma2 family endonuclease
LVVEAVGVRVPDGLFVPDVVVADRSKALEHRSGVLPAEVVELVVEVVCPGSRSMDRLAKPSLYARAGIRFYWRIELEEGPSIHAYRLEDDAYVEFAVTGPGQVLEIVEPFQIVVRPEELTR